MSDSTPVPTSVYKYYDASGVLLYVGITSRGTRRQAEHNAAKEWWTFVARQEVEHFEDRPSALARERDLIRRHLPPFNRQHNPDSEACRTAYLAFRDMTHNQPKRWQDAARALQRQIPLEPHLSESTNRIVFRTRLEDIAVVTAIGLPEHSPARVYGLNSKKGPHVVKRLEKQGPVALIHTSSTSTHPVKDAYATVKFDAKQEGLILRNVHARLDHSDPDLCTKRCPTKKGDVARREIRWVRPDSEGRERIY